MPYRKEMQFSNVIYCQLWTTPLKITKVCDLPAGSILLDTGGRDGDFMRVIYPAAQEFIGWVESVYVDEIQYQFPYECVMLDHPTATRQDLPQFVFVDGKLQYNLCGEIAVCFIAGVALSELLEKWKAYPCTWYQRVFQNGLARTTGIADLYNMLAVFPTAEFWSLNIFFQHYDKMIISPTRIKSVLRLGYKLIISVKINARGRVSNSGVLHWVVIVDAVPNGVNAGWIDFYNPATNNIERMDWINFSTSMGTPYGIGARVSPDESNQ